MGDAWRSISQADIFAAHRRIAGAVTRTPLIRAHALSDRLGGEIWFKLECLQPTGAFKLRARPMPSANYLRPPRRRA